MKPHLLIIILPLLFLFSGCKKNSIAYFDIYQENKIIAFQPLDTYQEDELAAISEEISKFYGKKVIILNPMDIPKTFFSPIAMAYSADSIAILLSKLQNDTIAEIIGLTHNSIYTIKESKYLGLYYDVAIFGMGYLPGNSCIVSDIRLSTKNTAILNHRMRNVIIHEIGHNAGLDHCPDNKCIMSRTNGNIPTLDAGPNDYCSVCKNKIKK